MEVPASVASVASAASAASAASVTSAASAASAASGGTTSGADAAWQVVTSDGDVDMTNTIRLGWSLAELRTKVGDSVRSVMKTFGGPVQFLEHRYPDAAARQAYADKLWAEFPAMDTHPPHSVVPLPSVREHEAHNGQLGSDLVLSTSRRWTSARRPP